MITEQAARRQRALRRAAGAWRNGKPHQAVEIILAAGLGDAAAREFVRQATHRARRTYQVRMARG
jgi:hypothetical protein